MGETRSFWNGLGYGLILGIIAAGVASSIPDFINWMNRWQTLITGVLAVVVGGSTIFFMRSQIRQQSDMNGEARKRKDWAARAVLSHALDDLNGYAKRCVEVLSSTLEAASAPPTIRCPPLPKEALLSIRDAVEHANPLASAALAELAAWTQIQSARVRAGCEKFNRGSSAKIEVLGYIADSVEMHARADRLYEYARRRSDVPGPVDLRTAAANCDLDDWVNDDLYAILKARQKKIDEAGGGFRN